MLSYLSIYFNISMPGYDRMYVDCVKHQEIGILSWILLSITLKVLFLMTVFTKVRTEDIVIGIK